VQDEVSAATAMLGLDGFVLLAVRSRTGSWNRPSRPRPWRSSAAAAGCKPGCTTGARPGCGTHRRPVARSRWCGSRGLARCPVVTWTETSEVRLEACRRVGADGHSVAQVAAECGVAWATVMAAVVEYGTPLVEDPARLERGCGAGGG
jgi:hypothetical protein